MSSSRMSRGGGGRRGQGSSSSIYGYGALRDYVPDDVTPEQIEEMYRSAPAAADPHADVGDADPIPDEVENEEEMPDRNTISTARQPRKISSDIFRVHFKKSETPNHEGKAVGTALFKTICIHGFPTKIRMSVASQTQLNFQGASSHSAAGGEGTSSQLFTYSEQNMRTKLAQFVAAKSLPFNFADDDFYESFVQTGLNPAVKRVSRHTVTRDIRKQVHVEKFNLR